MKGSICLLFLIGLMLAGCKRKTDLPAGLELLQEGERMRYLQYLDAGRHLYTIHCSNCHQTDGSGLRQLYPPLQASEFLVRFPERTICSMRYGLRGIPETDSEIYSLEMPGNPQLSDLEIAEIATYAYNAFADSVRLWSTAEVTKILAECTGP